MVVSVRDRSTLGAGSPVGVELAGVPVVPGVPGAADVRGVVVEGRATVVSTTGSLRTVVARTVVEVAGVIVVVVVRGRLGRVVVGAGVVGAGVAVGIDASRSGVTVSVLEVMVLGEMGVAEMVLVEMEVVVASSVGERLSIEDGGIGMEVMVGSTVVGASTVRGTTENRCWPVVVDLSSPSALHVRV